MIQARREVTSGNVVVTVQATIPPLGSNARGPYLLLEVPEGATLPRKAAKAIALFVMPGNCNGTAGWKCQAGAGDVGDLYAQSTCAAAPIPSVSVDVQALSADEVSATFSGQLLVHTYTTTVFTSNCPNQCCAGSCSDPSSNYVGICNGGFTPTTSAFSGRLHVSF